MFTTLLAIALLAQQPIDAHLPPPPPLPGEDGGVVTHESDSGGIIGPGGVTITLEPVVPPRPIPSAPAWRWGSHWARTPWGVVRLQGWSDGVRVIPDPPPYAVPPRRFVPTYGVCVGGMCR